MIDGFFSVKLNVTYKESTFINKHKSFGRGKSGSCTTF